MKKAALALKDWIAILTLVTMMVAIGGGVAQAFFVARHEADVAHAALDKKIDVHAVDQQHDGQHLINEKFEREITEQHRYLEKIHRNMIRIGERLNIQNLERTDGE